MTMAPNASLDQWPYVGSRKGNQGSSLEQKVDDWQLLFHDEGLSYSLKPIIIHAPKLRHSMGKVCQRTN